MGTNFKKVIKVTIALVIIYQLLGVTGVFKVCHNPTTANEPNIKMNSYTIASNLVEPKNKDFICYNFEDEFLGKHIRVHRLLGREGDVIEIKKGVFYINNINVDKDISLMHLYTFPIESVGKLTKMPEILESPSSRINNQEKRLEVILEDDFVKIGNMKSERLIEKKGYVNKEVQSYYNKSWNKDNFGPLKVPKGKVFVMGDNRDFTIDSRTIGLIDTSDIVGVMIK